MARTTAEAVQGLLGRQYDEDLSVDVFIDTASVVVDRMVQCAARKSVTFTAAELELIERWLACHYYGSSDQFLSSKSTGGASGSYQGQTAMGLEGTKYGQSALGLDHSGCLSVLGKAKPRFVWLGKAPSERTPYNQRD